METEPLPQSPLPPQPPAPIRYGSYETSIDKKRRLVLPAEVRYGMDPQRDGRSFFVFIGKNLRIWFYPRKQYIQLVSNVKVGLIPSDDNLELYEALVGDAFELEWDKQGRVIVPERLLRRAHLDTLPAEVTLVGTVDFYQLLPRKDWEERSDKLGANLGTIVNRARESGLTL
jgi:MraZ protein